MNKLLFYLTLLFRTDYWFMNNSYSNVWDTKLNRLMEKHDFNTINSYTAKLGNITIWVDNHPYSSFTPYMSSTVKDLRPSRYTIYKARKKLIEDALKQIL